MGADWALNNPTVPVHEQLVPLREALRGHHRLHRLHGPEVSSGASLGKADWFKCFPFVIVAINILIAVVQRLRKRRARAFGTTWVSTEGVTLYGGWHNVFNGIAGILNIFVHDRLVGHLHRPRRSRTCCGPT